MTTDLGGALPWFPAGTGIRRVLAWLRGGSGVPGAADLLVIGGSRPCQGAGADRNTGPAVADLYRDRRVGLVRLALLLVDDLPSAEDVVQDAFTAVYRRHGPVLRDVDNVAAYLSTAVVNAARSVLRRRRSARGLVPRRVTGPAVDERLLLAEEHREVLDALAGLAPRQREVLVLRYWSELSEAQIAEALGLSRGTVKSTASRALAALEKRMEGRR